MNTQTKGDSAELAVARDFRKAGYNILFPYSENLRYDLAVDDGSRVVKVQVKSSTFDDGTVSFSCYNGSSSSEGNDTIYEQGDFDALAVYCDELDQTYLIPFEDMNTYSMQLSPRLDAKHPREQYRLESFL